MKPETTLEGAIPVEKLLSWWDADSGLTRDGRTLKEFIEMIQHDAYAAGGSHGFKKGEEYGKVPF